MATLVEDVYDRTFDLENVHMGTCLSVDDDDWFIFRTPRGWIDDQGTLWSSEELADYGADSDNSPRFKRLN